MPPLDVDKLRRRASVLNLDDFKKESDTCSRIKCHIILCRRKGQYDPAYIAEQFKAFKETIDTHIEEIVEKFSARYLLSVLECYVDCGSPSERAGALAISAIINWERYKLLIMKNAPGAEWHDGFRVMSEAKSADSYVHLFSRIGEQLDGSTQSLSKAILGRLFEKEDFTLNQLGEFQSFGEEEMGAMREGVLSVLEGGRGAAAERFPTVAKKLVNRGYWPQP